MDCFVALGANIGDVQKTLRDAAHRIEKLAHNFQLSKLYWTEPVSSIPQPKFLNACCRFQCTLSLRELFFALREIERDLGKVPKPRESPRPIDLDLLFYGEEIHFESDLILPHPRWHERLFVVEPLCDIAPLLPFGIDAQKLLEKLHDRYLRPLCH